MATNFRRMTANATNGRSVLRNKLANDEASNMNAKRKGTSLSKMSAEAQRAMLQAKEDSKENFKSSPKSDSNNNSNDNNNNNFKRHGQNSVSGTANISKPIPKLALQRNRKGVSTAGANTTTTRSRSTLSRTDKTYSTNDNNESYVDRSNKGTRNANPPSSVDNNGSNANDEDSNDNGNYVLSRRGSDNEEVVDSYDYSDDSSSRRHSKDVASKSFVFALDRALEENCISRLRGDITDTQGISEPGKVRALDGGRLTNAQEVVVNVCHEDDRELVFHDDDDESLDNAKTISSIRVNIWMEYNEKFEPDNITDDLDIGTTNDDTDDSLDSTREKSKLKVPSKSKSGMPPNGRDSKTSSKNNTPPGSGGKSKSQLRTIKKDANSNRVGSARSKSGASGSYRDTSSTRWGSAISNDGSRQSGNSSAKKRELSKYQT